MRLTALLCFLALHTSPVFAEGTTYGAGLTTTEVVKISTLMDTPDAYVGKVVQVEGVIEEVCPKAGCWVKVTSDRPSESLTVKVKDGEIVFPAEAKGKAAKLEGTFTATELTHEQAIEYQRHRAEELGEAFDPASVTGAMTIYRIMGTGAVIP